MFALADAPFKSECRDTDGVASENVELVRQQHEHFTRAGEFLAENAVPEVEWMAAREDPDAATHRGKEAIQRYFDQWTETIEGMGVEALEIHDAGETVFAWVRFTGKGVASGADVEMEQAQVWRFRDGRVTRVEEYFDRDEGLAAAGIDV
jgi:ketosteroid isomerase-like protein